MSFCAKLRLLVRANDVASDLARLPVASAPSSALAVAGLLPCKKTDQLLLLCRYAGENALTPKLQLDCALRSTAADYHSSVRLVTDFKLPWVRPIFLCECHQPGPSGRCRAPAPGAKAVRKTARDKSKRGS